MRALLTGASGFIGRHLARELRAKGHTVLCTTRRPGPDDPFLADLCDASIRADFTRDAEPDAWLPRLQGVDVVINAVGIFRERGAQTFQLLHVDAPAALFDACAKAGVSRVIQISALGADANAASRYHLSKRRADRHLATLPVAWTIVQPSLVFGADGESARLFAALATLPCIPLPGRGDQRIQPIHIDDLAAGIAALLDDRRTYGRTIPFVGPQAIPIRDYLQALRHALGFGVARTVHVPLAMVRLAARLGESVSGSLLDPETLAMLNRGNTGDPAPVQTLLGHEARPPGKFIAPHEAARLRTVAQLAWLLPLLRWSIAVVWIVTGIVSLGFFPVDLSYQLLERVGIPRPLAPLFLYSAAALDLALGMATLLMRRRRALWLAQMALILGYTALITARMPEFWLHPYGPLLKNLPMLAAIGLLYRLERR
jgi:uncharacterized protein YbjT (DUF2867 family)